VIATYGFYACICLILMVFQTAAIPFFFNMNDLSVSRCYDLLIPFVLYLAVFRPAGESLAVIFFLGFITDNFSACPFGLFTATYFWLFVSAKWVIKFLHTGNYVILPFIAALGVLEGNIIFFGTIVLLTDYRLPADAGKAVAEQVLWSLCSGGFFLIFLNYLHKKWDRWLNEFSEKENED